ncbi:hypothetical protein FRB98_001279 [Tulasnella sp. 332]|nr:hypothetical protein FRB98_001279 [Tulasnella sp. 332]
MPSLNNLIQIAALLTAAAAIPTGFENELTERATETDTAKRATCTVNSVASAANLSGCTTVVITAFTVPSGSTLTLAAASGATITQTGDIPVRSCLSFCTDEPYLICITAAAAGPLLTFSTNNVIYNGGDHKINGNGASYWDGQGTDGGVAKPHPFIKFKGYGTFEDVTILNSPAQAISVGTTGSTVIQGITVDNSAGDAGALGHNTDGFDISASSVTLSKNVVKNQAALLCYSGSAIVIEDMTCSGGHGISIGSIATGKTVSGVKIARNTITNGLYGLRIKVDADATSASVLGVTYEANVISDITEYGVLITQSYPDNDGTPGTGAPISGVAFTGGTTSVAVGSSAYTLVIDCGACSGTWDFSGLHATGGKGHIIAANKATISGGTY